MEWLSRIALALIIIGAVNWLFVGLFQWDLVAALFGGDSVRTASGISRVIYSLVGLAGLYAITFFFKENVIDRTEK